MSNDGTFVLKWDLHEETRTSTLKSLWKNEDFLDVTIACDDDQIDAHKVILSAASPFFESILKRNPHNHPLLYLRGTNKKDMQSLLTFIYSGETQVPEEEFNDFMALATSLQIKGLAGEVMGRNVGKEDESIQNKRTPRNKETTRKEEKPEKGKYERCDASPKIIEERLAQKVMVTSKRAEKEANSRKTPTLNKDNHSLQENLQMVEISDYIGDSDHDVSDIIKKYASSEDDVSFNHLNTSNTSFTEYDEKVMEFVAKSGDVWTCTGCAYSAKNKNHVQEHAEKHVEGYLHACEYCGKAFSRKRKLRQNGQKCRKEGSKIPWM